MLSSKKLINIAGWIVFAVAMIVYYLSAERVGSLWDCGEFILGAQKLQVVHPPGAPLFMIIGRLFTMIAELFSNDPADIAFSVNLMSGVCTAFSATFIAWITGIFGKLALVGKGEELSQGQGIAVALAALVAGLTTAFSTSIWFSAVEGEVYAMSTFFTAMTIWSSVKWYSLPDSSENDRWLVFSLFSVGLSVGVHLLSLLALPALGLLFYYKKFNNKNLLGALLSMAAGVAYMVFIQKIIVVGIPSLWATMEMLTVNGMGLPFHSGLIPTVIILGALAYFLLKLAHKNGSRYLQLFTVVATLNAIAFSLIGVIVIRANADTPVNMNVPSDVMRLIPYINREQYGSRALLYGPHFMAEPSGSNSEKVYGQVGDRYEHVSDKISYKYKNKDKILFPRISDMTASRRQIYNMWRDQPGNSKKTPNMADNIEFLVKYQLNWMYGRYFMWNFVGRQNGDQGYFRWDNASGNWRSGITPIDEMFLYKTENEPDRLKNSKANNNYYFIPFILGFIGLFWHLKNRPKDFLFLAILFIITGIGIIIYSNQPPNEPRERDYVLVGSFMTFAIWVGMSVLAMFNLLANKIKSNNGLVAACIAGLVAITAPAIMLQQNFDDHSRAEHTASRDYASNFLNSLEPNAIIFTYGDNDTYPLWYAQEVENIRTDVRVVNLSLIAVDWYINKLRNKVNDSPPIKMTIDKENYTGYKRNVLLFANNNDLYPLDQALQIANTDKRLPGANKKMLGYLPSRTLMIQPDREKAIAVGMMKPSDPDPEPIIFRYNKNKQYLLKDDVAILDLIGSNIYDRPIYFAITCENSKLQGINDYMQLEGLALRIVPFKNKGVKEGGVAYSGSVNGEKLYDNVMNKWKWGNFDKKDLFVDDSYSAATLAMRSAMKRGAADLYQSGQSEKAVELVKKYFEAFPNMNFHYTYDVIPFIDILVRTKSTEEAKKQLRILALEAKDNLDFFESIDPDIVESSFTFKGDTQRYLYAANDVIRLSRQLGDATFTTEMENIVGEYLSTRQQVPN